MSGCVAMALRTNVAIALAGVAESVSCCEWTTRVTWYQMVSLDFFAIKERLEADVAVGG